MEIIIKRIINDEEVDITLTTEEVQMVRDEDLHQNGINMIDCWSESVIDELGVEFGTNVVSTAICCIREDKDKLVTMTQCFKDNIFDSSGEEEESVTVSFVRSFIRENTY